MNVVHEIRTGSQRAVREHVMRWKCRQGEKFNFCVHIMVINNSTQNPSKSVGTYRVVKTKTPKFSYEKYFKPKKNSLLYKKLDRGFLFTECNCEFETHEIVDKTQFNKIKQPWN